MHDRPQRAVRGLDGVERGGHRGLVGDVGLGVDHARAQAGEVLVGRRVEVGDADPGARREQAADGRQAEPGRTAGDQGGDGIEVARLLSFFEGVGGNGQLASSSMTVALAMPPASHIVCSP